MNVYDKLQQARVELQNLNLKKSGVNKFVGFKYYDLADLLPSINRINLKYSLFSKVSFTDELATITIINCEKPDEIIEFTSPMSTLALKGAHDIQNLGGIQTYMRRYLYVDAYEIVEHDELDSTLDPDKVVKPVESHINTALMNKMYKAGKERGYTPLQLENACVKLHQRNIIELTKEEYDEMLIGLTKKPKINGD